MTHTAAFAVQPELAALVEAQSVGGAEPKLAAIKVSIVDETFVLDSSTQVRLRTAPPACAAPHDSPLTQASDDAAADFASVVGGLDANTACYIVMRSREADGGGWVLVSYVPDTAPARQKMMYSSGHDALRKVPPQ